MQMVSHRPLWADAMGAIADLVFYGRIPPRIEVNDVVGPSEIETNTTCSQADEEDIAVARLKLGDCRFALCLRRLPVEVRVRNPIALEIRPSNCQRPKRENSAKRLSQIAKRESRSRNGYVETTVRRRRRPHRPRRLHRRLFHYP